MQGLDDEAHRHRKRMLMSLMGPERIGRLAEAVAAEWRSSGSAWTTRREIVLYDELPGLLTRAVCAWAGVPLARQQEARRTRQLRALFDGAGAVGSRHVRSRLSRKNADRWIAGMIEEVRAGRLHPPEGSAAHVAAWRRQLDGALLSPDMAAVELRNVLRPTVAIAVYATFSPTRSTSTPKPGASLARADPTTPTCSCRNSGVSIRSSPPSWPRCGTTSSGGATASPGGGRACWTCSAPTTTRAPGSRPRSSARSGSADMLGRQMSYDVPDQDLRIDFARLPALPRSRFIMRNVRLAERG